MSNPEQCNDNQAMTPKGRERQRRILDAAREVFLEQGFENASIGEIMKRAGGSMSTLYRCFGNKLGLFEAMMQQATNDLFDSVDDRVVWHDGLEEGLRSFGRRFIEQINTPNAIALFRLVISVNGADREDIQRIFYANGPGRVRSRLTEFLSAQADKGRINVDSCELAAGQFIDLIKEPWHQQALFGVSYPSDLPEKSLEQGIALFLNGVKAKDVDA
ncbi:TetR/AcrR family transcriptional regulator [Marinobacterium mangrovicola]|uniref:TetR family transcriptional regulator n=1 Tax=Marinobacterium mangrovicola TaxID=1476959 RepID=A0A4R1GHB5_9GAMM|nr:TetR/AcrR family transcriptional regulator [Marinobacterium mangrovicola]TCK07518.1 TetR family transcriptional regulator [Marinobacterium mangrovicola]